MATTDAQQQKEKQEDLKSALAETRGGKAWEVFSKACDRLGYEPEIIVDFKLKPGSKPSLRAEGNHQALVVPSDALQWGHYNARHFGEAELKHLPHADAKTQKLADAVAAQTGVPHMQVLVTENGGYTTVFESREGTLYVQIEKKYLGNPNLAGVFAHEFGHVKAGEHNHAHWEKVREQGTGAVRAAEDAADRFAVEHCYGRELTQLKVSQYTDARYQIQQAGLDPAETFARDQHTPLPARVAWLANMTVEMQKAGICKAEPAGGEIAAPGGLPAKPVAPGKGHAH